MQNIKMQNKDFILGIDTSNYTTSLALTDINGEIIIDSRKLLTVKQGEIGLRQSHALFQHMENLPNMILEIFMQNDKSRIAAIAVSNRPRPIEGSYMPVFKAGVNYAKIVAASLGVPMFEFSHQEGHIEAIKQHSCLENEAEFLAYHLSGGTCELLHIKDASFLLLGESKDLSFGQVIDRIGVALGMEFPAGKSMDQIALKMDKLASEKRGRLTAEASHRHESTTMLLKKVPINGFDINLSGMETQCQRELKNGADPELLIYELFLKISQCLITLTEKAITDTHCSRVLFSGGVASSMFIRNEFGKHFLDKPILKNALPNKSIALEFGNQVLSSDNGVGISFLGGNKLWRSNQ